MPYLAANDIRFPRGINAFIDARDNVLRNDLMQRQQAGAEGAQQAQQQNMLFQQNRQTQQDQVAAQTRAQASDQQEEAVMHAHLQQLAGALNKSPELFGRMADAFAAKPLFQKHGLTRDKITPENLQYLLSDADAEAGQGPAPPPVTYKTAPGPRGSLVQTDSTGKATQVVGPDNSQPKPEAAINPDSVESTAQMIANNQIPMLSGYALKSPWGQAVVGRVRELNPQFAGADYGANAAGIKQFTSGKNGNTIRSLNVAVQHLDQLGVLAQALGNGDVPAVNRVANWWKSNTGQAAPTNFNAAKKIVADEIVKAIVGSGGGVADREEASKSITAAGSPAQLAQVIETYQGLMTGQLNGLRQQYQTATGRDNFETLLLPETRAKLEAHGSQEQQVPTATGPNGQKLYLRNGQWVPK